MITSGASCPDALVERVIAKLAALTGHAAALQQVISEWVVPVV
jgi:4-hydroxy-3-methylbut-2-enyl diphosphate reductase IspH